MRHTIRNHSLLWRIQGLSGAAPSYVFGTIHVKADFAFIGLSPVLEAIEYCQAFAAELSLEAAAAHSELANTVLADPQRHLPTVLSADKYAKIKALLARTLQIDLDQLAHLRPMLLMNMLDESFMPPATRSVTLDAFLWNQAKVAGKAIYGLETVQSQVQIMQQMPPADEVTALLQRLKNIRSARRQVHNIIEWYQQGNIQQIYRASYRSLGRQRRVLLTNRNQVMADRIEAIGQHETVFAAIGAAHLAGKNGVLALLKRKGYVVNPARQVDRPY